MQHYIKNTKWQQRDLIYVGAAIVCLFPFISSPIALIFGFTLALIGYVPLHIDIQGLTKKLLAYSIVGLGFGINLNEAIEVSKNGLGLIVVSITATLALGWIISKRLKLDKKTGYLISAGTAICGGSAIAAVSPAIDADNDQTSVALATIFILNSIALFVFPVIGHLLEMSQHAFGVWSAIAIHDTSSVVGAVSAYGEEALVTATTLKLSRALWIVPIAFFSTLIFKGNRKKISIPLFIVFYCVAISIAHFLPQFSDTYQVVFEMSKRLLVLCLFLIGSTITLKKIKNAGAKPMILGLLLWFFIGLKASTM